MSKSINAGDLNRRIDITQKSTIRGALGEFASTYDPFLSNVPAHKADISGTEKLTPAGRETSIDKTEFRIRYLTTIKPATMRLVCEGVEYDIENVREGEGRPRTWTVITAKRRD